MLKLSNDLLFFFQDLFHNPPSFKSSVTLSWKPPVSDMWAVFILTGLDLVDVDLL